MSPSWHLARMAVGLVYVGAGALKLADPAPLGLCRLFRDGPDDPMWMAPAIAALEIVVGLWLLLGRRARLALACSAFIASLFCLYHLHLALFAPTAQCGCLGRAAGTRWGGILAGILLASSLALHRLSVERARASQS